MDTDSLTSDLAEESVLGAVLLDPSVFPDVAEIVTPASFAAITNRVIFTAMQQVANRGAAPDYASVDEVLRLGGEDDIDLTELTLGFILPMYAADYARRVRHHANRRHVLSLVSDLFSTLHADAEADPVEVVNAALAHVNEIVTDDGGPVLYAAEMEALQARLTDQLHGLWEDRVLPTGLHDLDARITGGFRAADLIILAARPGMGKSAMAMQWVHNVARRKEPALMFSAEMDRMSLIERGLSEVSGVDADALRQKKIGQGDYDRLMRAAEQMAQMPVAIDETPAIRTKQMLARAQRFQRQHGLSMVVFDYMELAGDDSSESEQLRITRISHALKGMAKTMKIPVVALSQLNRKVEDRNPPIPHMSDIRMSGAIEQDADKILFLYRPDYYVEQRMIDPNPEKEGITDIIIGKQRNGRGGTVPVRFDGNTMRFTNLSDHPSDSYNMRTLV